MLILHLGKEDRTEAENGAANHLFNKAKPEVIRVSVPFNRSGTHYLKIPDGWTVAGTIVYFANHVRPGPPTTRPSFAPLIPHRQPMSCDLSVRSTKGNPVLVIGAAGDIVTPRA
eukprot:CAMPEP_0185291322 /NCGR_PEP_ID=MMETSP1363-20130426/5250_1 /TAXON_ID=38817 /ORGANISM="Gephyrocapsa oceanica, Strain RCC1303" /LENGTH=113 /DNA_ID=CAMNT_0027887429 /DNA_START=154 /DNA_END=495 /DNA_ORIENTATION=+